MTNRYLEKIAQMQEKTASTRLVREALNAFRSGKMDPNSEIGQHIRELTRNYTQGRGKAIVKGDVRDMLSHAEDIDLSKGTAKYLRTPRGGYHPKEEGTGMYYSPHNSLKGN